ncbi:MAG: hypothetical protein P8H98_13080 [Flavobacteriales bacterium]|nr:hypothetical protein [Flavobacteriales bacterium]
MNKKEQQEHCKICSHQLSEEDFDDTCIDCAVFNQAGMLATYKKNMIAASRKKS